MIYNSRIELDPKAEALMARLGSAIGLGQAIAGAMDRENDLTINQIKKKITGPVLRRRTGRLVDSIQSTDALVLAAVSQGGGGTLEVRSSLGSNVRFGGKSVEYAAIHEFGGRTRAHVILPKRGKVLVFQKGGKQVFCTKVNHPGSVMPERSYVRSSIMERMPNYKRSISNSVIRFYKGLIQGRKG